MYRIHFHACWYVLIRSQRPVTFRRQSAGRRTAPVMPAHWGDCDARSRTFCRTFSAHRSTACISSLVLFAFLARPQVHECLNESFGDFPEPVQAQPVEDGHCHQHQEGHGGGEFLEERAIVVAHEQAHASEHVDSRHEPDRPEEDSVEQVRIGFLGSDLMEEVPQVDVWSAHFRGNGGQHDEVSFFRGKAEHQAEDGSDVMAQEIHSTEPRIVRAEDDQVVGEVSQGRGHERLAGCVVVAEDFVVGLDHSQFAEDTISFVPVQPDRRPHGESSVDRRHHTTVPVPPLWFVLKLRIRGACLSSESTCGPEQQGVEEGAADQDRMRPSTPFHVRVCHGRSQRIQRPTGTHVRLCHGASTVHAGRIPSVFHLTLGNLLSSKSGGRVEGRDRKDGTVVSWKKGCVATRWPWTGTQVTPRCSRAERSKGWFE
mmetsp:Transcript_7204/g.44764  ORF Transcript_7204/g.44764 Transcript_7204/m.44764 type:complete len:427 (+) Transcript_7204:2168-3448(+)